MALKTGTVHLTTDRGQHLVPSRRSLPDIPASSERFKGNDLFLFSDLNKTTTTARGQFFFPFKIKEQQVTTDTPTLLPDAPPPPCSLHKETIELSTG